MTPGDELAALYQKWRTLTEDEGRAIAAESWTDVRHFQHAKARLQPRIVEVSQRLDRDVHYLQFTPLLEELMKLERRNGALLLERRQTADRARESLDRSSRNLRQLHKSYVPSAKTLWQSYS